MPSVSAPTSAHVPFSPHPRGNAPLPVPGTQLFASRHLNTDLNSHHQLQQSLIISSPLIPPSSLDRLLRRYHPSAFSVSHPLLSVVSLPSAESSVQPHLFLFLHRSLPPAGRSTHSSLIRFPRQPYIPPLPYRSGTIIPRWDFRSPLINLCDKYPRVIFTFTFRNDSFFCPIRPLQLIGVTYVSWVCRRSSSPQACDRQ